MNIQQRMVAFPVLESEWENYHLDQRINDYGIALDMDFVDHAILCDEVNTGKAEEKAKEVTGIAKEMAERSKRTGVNQDRVVLELAKIAFVKMTDSVDDEGRIKSDATDDDLACIESVKFKESYSDTGSMTEREVKIASKMKALELLVSRA